MSTIYLVDADVLIQAKNRHYAFDVCPGFWEWLDQAHETGSVGSVEAIGDELKAGGDELARWARDRPDFFSVPDEAVLASLRELSTWASNAGNYDAAARNTFLGSGDLYLIAHAHAHGHAVVTHEVPAPESKKRVKIPDACNALGVPWTDPFDMLRKEGVRFGLRE